MMTVSEPYEYRASAILWYPVVRSCHDFILYGITQSSKIVQYGFPYGTTPYRKDVGDVFHDKSLGFEVSNKIDEILIQFVPDVVNDSLTGYREALTRRSSNYDIHCFSFKHTLSVGRMNK